MPYRRFHHPLASRSGWTLVGWGLAIFILLGLGLVFVGFHFAAGLQPTAHYVLVRSASGSPIYLKTEATNLIPAIEQTASASGYTATETSDGPGANGHQDCADSSAGTITVWDDGSTSSQTFAREYCRDTGWG